MRTLTIAAAILLAASIFAAGTQKGTQDTKRKGTTSAGTSSKIVFSVPKSMKQEHEELHSALEQLTHAGGQTGEAARAVVAALEKHFEKENEFALPPLSLLVPLSHEKFDCRMTAVLALTQRFEADLPNMLSEHKVIGAALKKLSAAATAENKPAGVQFAKKLMAHAQAEEEITYPAALLVGRYVNTKAAQCKP